jgi:hypothetical protein
MLVVATMKCFAQKDSTAFRAYLINNEYEVYLRINFYDQNIKIPGQELYGELPGFLGRRTTRSAGSSPPVRWSMTRRPRCS